MQKKKTTIEVSKDTAKELHELKEAFGFASLDALISEMVLILKYKILEKEQK